MVIRYMQKTWVKTLITLAIASTIGWFVFSRDIVSSNGVFSHATMLPGTTEGQRTITNSRNVMKPIPPDAKALKEHVVISATKKQIQNTSIFFREAILPAGVEKSGKSILLLHGQRFTSQNWEDIGTLALMAALGHRVIAIDLPGYGKSSTELFTGDKTEFLKAVFEELTLVKPVLVSPSMSGFFSLKFLESYPSLLAGFIPIAPVNSNTLSVPLLKKITVPTLIVYGSNDNTGLAKKSRNVLINLPNSREKVIEGAGHAAYLDQTDEFHEVLYNFMEEVPTAQ